MTPGLYWLLSSKAAASGPQGRVDSGLGVWLPGRVADVCHVSRAYNTSIVYMFVCMYKFESYIFETLNVRL